MAAEARIRLRIRDWSNWCDIIAGISLIVACFAFGFHYSILSPFALSFLFDSYADVCNGFVHFVYYDSSDLVEARKTAD